MTSERWQQIKAILHSALEQGPGGERAAFLDRACAGDESLRREIESLIISHERAGSLVEGPAVAALADLIAGNQPEQSVGRTLGRYRVLRRLGAGGMGEVYLAEDESLGRKVALKFLPPHLTRDHTRLQRFRHEARAASALNHPNILTIHEIGEEDGHPFIATEYVEGETLREKMASSPLKLSEALDVASQVASALAAAHAAGIVHRDVKPENVMLRHDGIVKVLDFGLAKLSEKRAHDSDASTLVQTGEGVVMGTVAYMSPEQARGLKVDARTDVWSLGCVLYEMVAGRAPFEGETATDVLLLIIEREPVPLARYWPEVPVELQRIVTKALAKDREKRYQTVKDLLIDLKSLREELEFEAMLARSAPPESRSKAGVRSEPVAAPTGPAMRPTSGGEYLVSGIRRHKRGAVLALAALIIALAAAAYLYSIWTSRSINSIAVLPLVNVNTDPDVEYLSDGITETIISSLSQLPGLKVTSRGSVFRYKGREVDPVAVGRELGVQTVLTGRVVRRGDHLSISMELVDVRDDSHLWGEQYERGLADLLALQREIPREVADGLRLKLSRAEQRQLTKRYKENVEAYQLYLKGRFTLQNLTRADAKQAAEYFQQAINLDPNYALAYAGLADSYSVGTGMPYQEELVKRKAAVRKALELDETLGEAHASLADYLLFHEWDFAGADREFKRAIELSPSFAEGHHMYAHYLMYTGRIDEAFDESRKNLELDPLSAAPKLHMGWQYLHAHQYDQAIEEYKKALQIEPNYTAARRQLGDTYYQKGMYAEAVEEHLKELDLNQAKAENIAALRAAFAASGIQGYLRKKIELLKEARLIDRDDSSYAYDIAANYAQLGDKGQAFEWLEAAYSDRAPQLVVLKIALSFESIRSDPRYVDLMKRVGLNP